MQNFFPNRSRLTPSLRYCDFLDSGCLPSLICLGHICTIRGKYLVVSVTMQKLVMIDAVMSIIRTFQYLVHFA